MMANEQGSVMGCLLSMSQKKFVPKVNGCGEHIVVANMAIK
jgi:hypothetical protein